MLLCILQAGTSHNMVLAPSIHPHTQPKKLVVAACGILTKGNVTTWLLCMLCTCGLINTVCVFLCVLKSSSCIILGCAWNSGDNVSICFAFVVFQY